MAFFFTHHFPPLGISCQYSQAPNHTACGASYSLIFPTIHSQESKRLQVKHIGLLPMLSFLIVQIPLSSIISPPFFLVVLRPSISTPPADCYPISQDIDINATAMRAAPPSFILGHTFLRCLHYSSPSNLYLVGLHHTTASPLSPILFFSTSSPIQCFTQTCFPYGQFFKHRPFSTK